MNVSFRDPGGRLLAFEHGVIRFIKQPFESELRAFLTTSAAQQFAEGGVLARTRFLDAAALNTLLENQNLKSIYDEFEPAAVVEHERIPFQSFPYEWPPEMLYAAAELTLSMMDASLDEDFGLKDATPYNVLFRGSQPVFIDLLSFERRDPLDPTWLAYAQFVRTFLLPLLVNKTFGIALDQIFLSRRDGLEPEDVARLCGAVQKFMPPFLSLVTLPAQLSKRAAKTRDTSLYQKRTSGNPEKARFILRHTLKGLKSRLGSVKPRAGNRSAWSEYMHQKDYSEEYFPEKEAFVAEALALCAPQRVLDVGCNTGHFSMMAANRGAATVSIDTDAVVVGELWRSASEQKLDVLPLVVNLARPSPAVGWLNAECASFLERANGAFDAVLMLAVIHHLLVTERIPLEEIMQLAAKMTNDLLVVEYVSKEDPMFRLIARGREHLHEQFTQEYFEDVSLRYFEIVRSSQLGGTRRSLYMMRKKRDV